MIPAQPAIAFQSAETPDLAMYESWLREAYSAAQRRDRLGLEEAAGRLTANDRVKLPDGSTARADNRWLAEALQGPDPDLQLISVRLGALIDALAQPSLRVDPQAQQKLRDILAQPPFASAQSSPPGWLERMLQALGDFLSRLFPTGSPLVRGSSTALGWLLLLIGAAAILALMVYAVYSLRRGIVSEARTGFDDPAAGLTASTALQQAAEIARGGDYRTAVRYLYLSSLLWLDERGMLRYDRALTNHEYLAQVRDNPELHARLLPVVETFDRVWYGHSSIDQLAFETYRQQIDELRRSARSF